jgi:hypothetical protein
MAGPRQVGKTTLVQQVLASLVVPGPRSVARAGRLGPGRATHARGPHGSDLSTIALLEYTTPKAVHARFEAG